MFLILLIPVFLGINPAFSSTLQEAATIQAATMEIKAQKELQQKNIEATERLFKKDLNKIFYSYYKEVEKAGIHLGNIKESVERINHQRSLTNSCCQISIAKITDDEKFLTSSTHDAMFTIQDYGVQTINGKIIDDQFHETGEISLNCMYEVFLSSTKSKKYDCHKFIYGDLNEEILNDIIETLPEIMKNHH